MKFGDGRAWKAHASRQHADLFPIFLAVLIGAAGLFLLSLLLPDQLAQVAQEFIGWCLAGLVAALALLASVKVLEDLLDS